MTTDFVDKMRLKGQADEDCYFARHDRELIQQRRARRLLPLKKIVSGGQTGVDRAALDVALASGLGVGGWCPRGRWAEDGTIPERYPLLETATADLHERTERNISNSDATLVLHRSVIAGGTRLTVDLAGRLRRPLRLVNLDQSEQQQPIRDWLRAEAVEVLNVAGPRESESPGIGEKTAVWLRALFTLR
jgi:hypothetical protein